MLELNKAYKMDCMVGMKEFPDKFFELAIVDPPYGINATEMNMGSNPNRKEEGQYSGISIASKIRRLNGGSGKLKKRALNTMPLEWDSEKPPPIYFEELMRISKNQIICGGNYYSLPPTRGFAIWDKKQPWENFSQCEFIWTSFDYPAKIFRFSNKGGANLEIKIHPTQKPVQLYKWLLEKYAKQGDKIIDTHGGSMSSVIACLDYGFEYICFEKDEFNFNNASKRITEYKAQGKLF